jgi:uncharacterized membrane protein (UPF0127 family)
MVRSNQLGRPSRGALHRTLVAGACLVGSALLAAGCGSDGPESSPSVGATVGEPVESVPPGATPDPGSTPDGGADDSVPVASAPAASGPAPAGGVQPEGFTTVTARVTASDGEVCEVCLWLADSDEERGRGLMGVTDLGDAAGMAFVFDPATTGSFYMYRTPTPLSIAWFGDDGAWVGATDMEPCLDATSERCDLYSPGGAAYTVGVETFAGGLEPLLMVDGSVIELIAGTEAPQCQTPSS